MVRTANLSDTCGLPTGQPEARSRAGPGSEDHDPMTLPGDQRLHLPNELERSHADEARGVESPGSSQTGLSPWVAWLYTWGRPLY